MKLPPLLDVHPARDTDYSIWPLAYCQSHMPYDFFGGAGLYSNKGIVTVPMIYTLLVGGEVGGKQHVALVDCGFQKGDWLKRYSFSGWEDPKDVLAKVGFSPEDVEAILVTHMHFDHIGNFRAFPNAKLYIQLDEYLGWSEAVCSAHQNMHSDEERAWILSSFDPEDLVHAAEGLAKGRLCFVRGEEEILPGITAHLAKDSHTFGTQFFMVRTHNGPFAVAGDTVYWYSNVEKMWPPGYNQGNAFNQIKTFLQMRDALKNETKRIIPGHDPVLWERHLTWVTASGNQVAEVNLRDGDKSRKPYGLAAFSPESS